MHHKISDEKINVVESRIICSLRLLMFWEWNKIKNYGANKNIKRIELKWNIFVNISKEKKRNVPLVLSAVR